MNTMYLVCVHHPDKAQAFALAERSDKASGYVNCIEIDRTYELQSLEAFFKTHVHCGGGFDHFTIAFELAKDHDLPKPAPVADGVHMALREAANEP